MSTLERGTVGACVLQIEEVANISRSHQSIQDELSGVVAPASFGPTYLKFRLTDGSQFAYASEMVLVPQFRQRKHPLTRGGKLLVNGAPVRHGLILLMPENVKLLRGSSSRHADEDAEAERNASAGHGRFRARKGVAVDLRSIIGMVVMEEGEDGEGEGLNDDDGEDAAAPGSERSVKKQRVEGAANGVQRT